MRFSTIWTIPLMRFTDRMKYSRDELARRIASRLPKRIRYWTTVCSMSGATTKAPLQHREMGSIGILEIMQHMDRPREIY